MSVSLFIIYALEDSDCLSQIENQLQVLVKNNTIAYWHQGNLIAGSDSRTVTNAELSKAQIVLPIVSAYFLASNDYMDLLKEADKQGKQIVPIIASSCLWEYDPILKGKTTLPRKNKDTKPTPLNKWSPTTDGYNTVVEGIAELVMQQQPIKEDTLTKLSTPLPQATTLNYLPKVITDKQIAYDQQSYENIKVFLDRGIALIVTATATETHALHQHLAPVIETNQCIIEFRKDHHTYYFAKFGLYPIVHVECEMGSGGVGSSIITISKAIDIFDPKFVLMLGIAFGINPVKQRFGDVLVAKIIQPYDSKKVDDGAEIYRGPKPETSKTLLDCFKNLRNWKYRLNDEGEETAIDAKMIIGDVLSGEELINDNTLRNKLQKAFPTSIGGEMEGAGLYAACTDKDKKWILVKGICDFADGKKTDVYQPIAATAAVNLCLAVFNKPYIFNDLGLEVQEAITSNRNNDTVPPANSLKANTPTLLQQAITLVTQQEFAEAFALLETLKINKPLYYQLKREYEGGTYKYDAQYADRLITFLKTL